MNLLNKFPELNTLANRYKNELFNNVIPFWQKKSPDYKYGGYFTCLDRKGNVYNEDKFIWLQARQVWMFSMLYNKFEKLSPIPATIRKEWLDHAKLGAEFLMENGMDENGNWYFALTHEGKPLVQPYSLASDCFAAMAFSQYALASGNETAKQIALNTYKNIHVRKENPKGKYNKIVSGSRPLIALGAPMILANLTFEMEWLLSEKEINQVHDSCINSVMNLFLDKNRNILFENVKPDGEQNLNCFEGRQITPGHGIEAMWFLMCIAEKRNDKILINKFVDIVLSTLDFSWDKKYEGIFYFMDAENQPPDKLEWDQKLWWVHLETLIALLMGFRLTGREECLDWFKKVHDYSWNNFTDPEFGEWFGYLNRKGEKLLNLKGGKWKGCFHLPRALFLCYQELEKLICA